MDTVIKFDLPTLLDHLEGGGEFTGKTKVAIPEVTQESGQYDEETIIIPNPEGEDTTELVRTPIMEVVKPAKLLYECEGCGCMCRPAELVDTSPFDGVPNDWMCGGCREKKCRDEFEVAKAVIVKPEEQNFTSAEEFKAADESYYKSLHELRCHCAKAFKKALLQCHNAPNEVLETAGVIDKDVSKRTMPPIAKASAPISANDQIVNLDIIDPSGGIQTGKKARIGEEEAEVTEVNGNQVTLNRAAPVAHDEGELAIFNLDEEGV